MDIGAIYTAINGFGSAFLILLVVLANWRGWIVGGATHQEVREDRDFYRALSTELMRDAIERQERLSETPQDAKVPL